jgi:hypothetical protein
LPAPARAPAVRPDRHHRHRRPEHRQHRPLALAARHPRQLIDQLAAAKAKTIVHTVFFIEPQTDRGLVFIRKMKSAWPLQWRQPRRPG